MTTVIHEAKRGVGLSDQIWRSGKIDKALADFSGGALLRDDFLGIYTFTSGTPASGYACYEDAGAAVASDTDDPNGVVTLTTGTTDNDEASLSSGIGFMEIASSSPQYVAFEARVKLTVLAEAAIFVGLADPTMVGANALVDATGAITDADVVGFHIAAQASSVTMDAIHRISGTAVVTVQSDVHTDLTSSLTADTYMTLGIKYEATDVTFYVDGELVGTVTDVTAATFPDGEQLAPVFAIKTGNTTSKVLSVDWFQALITR